MTLHTVSTSKSTYSSAFTSFFISPICMTQMNFLNRFLQCLGKNQECDVQFTLVFYFETLNDSSEKQVCTFHIFSQVRWYALLKKQPFSSMFQILSFKTLYKILAIASSIKDFFSKFDKIRSFLPIWAHLLNKSLMENFIFCAVWPFPWLPEFYWNKHFSMTFIATIFIIVIAFFFISPAYSKILTL